MNPYEDYYKAAVRQSVYSKFEDLLFSQIKGTGLTEPQREFKFHDERKWRFDFAWPEIKLAMEVEGGTWNNGRHSRGYGFEADCEKYNEAALAGWRVLRVTPSMVLKLHAINSIKRALANGTVI